MHLLKRLQRLLRKLFKPRFSKDEIQGAMLLNKLNRKEAIKWLSEGLGEDEKLFRFRRTKAITHLRVLAAEEAGFVTHEILNGVVGPSPEFGSGVRLHD